LAQIPALRPQVDGHSLYVIAIFCYPLVVKVQSSIGCRRAIAANHEKRVVRIEPIAEHPKQVQNAGIHRPDLVGMVVAKDPVDVPNCFPNVMPVGPINGPQPFAGMDVVEGNRTRSEGNCGDRIYKPDGRGSNGSTENAAPTQQRRLAQRLTPPIPQGDRIAAVNWSDKPDQPKSISQSIFLTAILNES
jgi:hypothetical protein